MKSLPDQPGHPPIREYLPARLARRAVGDLVGLVGDPAEVLPASRAWMAVTTVDREVIAEFRRETAGSPAFGFERLGENPADGEEERPPIRFLQGPQRGVGREPGTMKDVVGVPAPAGPRSR